MLKGGKSLDINVVAFRGWFYMRNSIANIIVSIFALRDSFVVKEDC